MAIVQLTLDYPSGAKAFQDTDLEAVAVAVKAASAVLYMIEIDNAANAAEAEYVKIYNTAGAVVPGTTVPDLVILIPAAVKRTLIWPEGLTLGTGLAILASTTGGTICTAAPTASLIVRVVYA